MDTAAAGERGKQLAYSELQSKMLAEDERRRKATKIIAVLRHFLGREDLTGLSVLDVGCSTGFIADELRRARAPVARVQFDTPPLAPANRRSRGAVIAFFPHRQPLPVRGAHPR